MDGLEHKKYITAVLNAININVAFSNRFLWTWN